MTGLWQLEMKWWKSYPPLTANGGSPVAHSGGEPNRATILPPTHVSSCNRWDLILGTAQIAVVGNIGQWSRLRADGAVEGHKAADG